MTTGKAGLITGWLTDKVVSGPIKGKNSCANCDWLDYDKECMFKYAPFSEDRHWITNPKTWWCNKWIPKDGDNEEDYG